MLGRQKIMYVFVVIVKFWKILILWVDVAPLSWNYLMPEAAISPGDIAA